MTEAVEKIAEQVKALREGELDEFLTWLAEYEKAYSDEWDRQIEQNSREGGALSSVLSRVRADIASGKAKPLDEVIDNS